MAITGGCLCGQVRYEISGEPMFTAICHCKNCQRQSGAAYSVNLGVPSQAFNLSGQLKTFVDTGESGGEVMRRFCANCGSPLISEVASAPAMVILKAGTLDDTSSVKPGVEVWCASRQPWVPASTDRPCFDRNPG